MINLLKSKILSYVFGENLGPKDFLRKTISELRPLLTSS